MTSKLPKPSPTVIKRSPDDRKRLPPELEAFAAGQESRLRLRRPRVDRGDVRDPREGYVIPGVANRDARSVFDARVAAMQQLWAEGEADAAAREELGELLADALRLRLWRSRRITDFAVLAEEIVGVPADEARELAEAASSRLGVSLSALSERDVAVWLRTESGLFEGDTRARARIQGEGGSAVLTLSVPLERASSAIAGAGFRHAPLARDRTLGPASGGDRRPFGERDRFGGDEPGRPSWEARELDGGELDSGELDSSEVDSSELEENPLDESELHADEAVGDTASQGPRVVAGPSGEPGASEAVSGGARLLTRARPRSRDDEEGRGRERRDGGERPGERAGFRGRSNQFGGRGDSGERDGRGWGRATPRFGDGYERGSRGDRFERGPRGSGPEERGRKDAQAFGRGQGRDGPRGGRGGAGRTGGFGNFDRDGERGRFGGSGARFDERRGGGRGRFERFDERESGRGFRGRFRQSDEGRSFSGESRSGQKWGRGPRSGGFEGAAGGASFGEKRAHDGGEWRPFAGGKKSSFNGKGKGEKSFGGPGGKSKRRSDWPASQGGSAKREGPRWGGSQPSRGGARGKRK